MSNVTVVQLVNATPKQAWALVGAPSSLSDWHPAIATSTRDGAARVCTMPDGARIEERILAHDDSAMSYRYKITDSPLPLKDYVSTIAVRPTASGCEICWSSDFEALAPAAEIEGMVRGLYEAGLESAKARLEA